MLTASQTIGLAPSPPFAVSRWYVLRSDHAILFGEYDLLTNTTTWTPLPPVGGAGVVTTIAAQPGIIVSPMPPVEGSPPMSWISDMAISIPTPSSQILAQLTSDNLQAFCDDGSIWNLINAPGLALSRVQYGSLPQT